MFPFVMPLGIPGEIDLAAVCTDLPDGRGAQRQGRFCIAPMSLVAGGALADVGGRQVGKGGAEVLEVESTTGHWTRSGGGSSSPHFQAAAQLFIIFFLVLVARNS